MNSESADTAGTQGGYSKIQLIYLAKEHYYKKNGHDAQFADYEEQDDGTVTIHLYNNEGDHITTCDWYYLDPQTGTGENLMGEKIDLIKD